MAHKLGTKSLRVGDSMQRDPLHVALAAVRVVTL